MHKRSFSKFKKLSCNNFIVFPTLIGILLGVLLRIYILSKYITIQWVQTGLLFSEVVLDMVEN